MQNSIEVEKIEVLDNRLIIDTDVDYVQPSGTQNTGIRVVECLNPNTSQNSFVTTFVRSDIIDSKLQFVNKVVYRVNLVGSADNTTINGTTINLGQDYTIAPYPFTTNCCGVCTLKLNSQQTDSKNLAQIGLYCHYLEDSKYAMINSFSPSKLDNFNLYSNSFLTTNSSFGNYNDATFNNVPNSCYSNCVLGWFTDPAATTATAIANNQAISNAAAGTNLYLLVQTTEYLPLAPFDYSGGKNSKSITGINTFDLSVNIDSQNATRAIQGVLANFINTRNGNITLTSVALQSIQSSKLVFTVLHAPLIAGYRIPRFVYYKSLYYDIRSANVTAFAGGTTSCQYTNIETSNGVPRYVLVWADTLKTNKLINQSNFSRYSIQNGSANFNMNCAAYQNLFSSYTREDLFRMTNRVLKKMSYMEFIGTAGAITFNAANAPTYASVNTSGTLIAMEMGVDVPLELGVKVGLNMPLRFDINKYAISDFADAGCNGKQPQINIMFVYERITMIDTESGEVKVTTYVEDVKKEVNVNKIVSEDIAEENKAMEGGMLGARHKLNMKHKAVRGGKGKPRIMSFIN